MNSRSLLALCLVLAGGLFACGGDNKTTNDPSMSTGMAGTSSMGMAGTSSMGMAGSSMGMAGMGMAGMGTAPGPMGNGGMAGKSMGAAGMAH